METRIAMLLSGIGTAWIPASALAHDYEDGRGFWPHDWEGGWGPMLFGSFGMILFWGGLILLIVLAVHWFGGTSVGAERVEPGDTISEGQRMAISNQEGRET